MATTWGVTLRIARRSALKSWGRSLLIVALIAVPIIGLSAAAVLLPSMQATQQEMLDNTLGRAQAKLTVVGTAKDHVRQGVFGGYDYATDSGSYGASSQETVDPSSALPAGTRVIAVGSEAATFALDRGAVSLQVETGETWDPVLDGGPYVLLSGRRPTGDSEVLLSPAALERLHVHVGDRVTMTTPQRRALQVVGVARDRGLPDTAQTVFAAAATVATSTSDVPQTYFVPTTPIDWATVERLNAIGTTALSRTVVADPPTLPADQQFTPSGPPASTIVVIGLALVFAVLEVALLAGSAFLVGARLQQRTLATIASLGADRSALRRIVTANGVVLGAIGGVVGVAGGIGTAIAFMRITDDGTWMRYPGLHLVWPLLAGIAIFGVVVGWIAALVPARAASRFDVVRALRGARTPQRVGRKPVAGIALVVAGVVAILLGGGVLLVAVKAQGDASTAAAFGALALLGGGSVLAQLGVLLCAGLVLRGVARLLTRAPLPARLAARDTSRNLGRAVPAVASVMTTVFVASFVMCIANTASIYSATQYSWQAPKVGDASSSIASTGHAYPTTAESRTWLATLRHGLPVAQAAVIGITPTGPDGDATPSNRSRDAMPIVHFPVIGTGCSMEVARTHPTSSCSRFDPNGAGFGNGQQFVTVGNATALGLLLGHAPSAAARSALEQGGAVALRSDLAPRGVASLDWFTPKQLAGDTAVEKPRRVTHVPTATDLPEQPIQTSLFVTPATARALGLTMHPFEVRFTFTRTPTQSEIDATNAALGAIANVADAGFVQIEQGPQDYGAQIAWWVLLACLVIAISAGATAIGLARVDGRADDVTLASLGGPARIRKAIAFVQALVICGTGAVIGLLLGLLPAIAIGGASSSYAFAPPVLQLALTAVGIPIVIAVGAWLLVGTRRVDLTRRAAIA